MNDQISCAIMASGLGSNAINLINHAQKGFDNKVHIATVISDKKEAPVLKKAESKGIPSHYISYSGSKLLHESLLLSTLQIYNVKWVLLAGYMRILSPFFLNHFKKRIINIHPSLLPRYPGKNAYEQAYQSNDSLSGVTVHFVDEGIDTGPIIMQQSFKRYPNDSLVDFKKRGLELEHRLYPRILDYISNGKLKDSLHE